MKIHELRANEFKAIVAKIIEPALAPLDYEMMFNPPGQEEEGDIWFVKMLPETAYLVIDFQHSRFKPHYVSSFAINLWRNHPMYTHYNNVEPLPGYFLGERLAPAIWIQDRHDPEWDADYWWRFQNAEDLHEACEDALSKLLTYGIPYLEDLDSKSVRLQAAQEHHKGLHGDSGEQK